MPAGVPPGFDRPNSSGGSWHQEAIPEGLAGLGTAFEGRFHFQHLGQQGE
jgi:hypothetical protein